MCGIQRILSFRGDPNIYTSSGKELNGGHISQSEWYPRLGDKTEDGDGEKTGNDAGERVR